MDITSGGTGGPRLSEQWWDREYNVAGCLKRWEPEALARVLAENGWSARKSSWFEFEVTREWVELCLIPAVAGQVTFSGVIDPSRLADLEATLGPLGAYEIEFTADDGTERLLTGGPATAPAPERPRWWRRGRPAS